MRWTASLCLAVFLSACGRLSPPPISEVCNRLVLEDINEVDAALATTRGQIATVASPSLRDSALTAAFVQANDYFYIDRLHVSGGRFRMETGWFLISSSHIDHEETCFIDGDTLYVRRTQ